MVVCQTQEDADLLRCLRAHGWTRELSNKDVIHASYPHIDPRFMFVNLGYNLRPMEISGAIGKCQLLRLDEMNANRKSNRARLISALIANPNWDNQLKFPEAPVSVDPGFGFVDILRDDLKEKLPSTLHICLSTR